MTEIKVDLEVICECGRELIVSKNTGSGQITVFPCEDCQAAKYDEGVKDGTKSRED